MAQLSRVIQKQIRVKKVVSFKPAWWMSAVMGQHNSYRGQVLGYAAIHGTGAAVVTLEPATEGLGDKEYDEEDVEVYRGDRDVLGVPVGRTAAGTGPGDPRASRPHEESRARQDRDADSEDAEDSADHHDADPVARPDRSNPVG